jgi:hypothetical protein
MGKRALATVLFLLLTSSTSRAQDPFNVAVPVDKLSTIFTNIYGPSGLIVDSLRALPNGQTHSAHFNSAFQAEFTQFGVALTSQLAAVPLPSPASGFTYEFDSDLGVFERTSQSFGPILAERAETIGGGRFTFGFTFQNFTFDTIEGLDIDSIPAVFTHDSAELRGGREDVVSTVNSIDARVNQFTAFISYGLTDRLDLSLAIPVVSTELTVISDARVERLGTVDPEIHFFREYDDSVGDRRTFTAFGSASGIGDLTLRLKGRLAGSMALGLDVRVPTGDEENLLGVGAPGIRPFLVLSRSSRAFSPHFNVGYLWNGSSVLGGNPATGEAADLPDQVTYVVGADFGVSQRFTFVLDVLGAYLIDAPRLNQSTFVGLDPARTTFPTVSFTNESYNLLSGAVGFKLNVVESLLVDVNLLFNLDNNGLRDKITPLIGFEYAF